MRTSNGAGPALSRRVNAYKRERVKDQHAPASINRVLQFVRQAFRLAHKRDLLPRVPSIELFSEKGNARHGFCEEAEFRGIHGFLPAYLKDFALFAYCTGMRFGEVRSLWELQTT
jgi:integrase